MWPRHRLHSPKLKAEPGLCFGLSPGTGSQRGSSLQQLRAKTGNGGGKDQSWKELTPGLFKTVETAATPPLPLQPSHLLACPSPREPASRVYTRAVTKKQKIGSPF